LERTLGQRLGGNAAAENPFMTTATRAAEPLLSNLPTPDAGAPGQFAFADGGRVRRILEASDWKNIDVRPIDVTGNIAEQDLLNYVTKLGPVGVAMACWLVSARA
jgi:hypothetical protein